MHATSITLGRRAAIGTLVALTAVLTLARQGIAQDSPEGVVDQLVGQIIELLQSDGLEGRDGIRRLAETMTRTPISTGWAASFSGGTGAPRTTSSAPSTRPCSGS